MRSFIVLLAIGCIAAYTPLALAEPPAPGNLIDMGGWRMHIHCTGDTRPGYPTVILEAGSSDFSIDWAFVQPKVATFARVCSYDRSGSGWSDLGPNPHTLRQIVFELNVLLGKAGESAPLIYVGHSYGGRLARIYASNYPADVRGIVFVDAGHEDSLMSLNGIVVREWELATGEPVPPPRLANPLRIENLDEDIRQHLEATAAQTTNRPVGPPHDKLPPELRQARSWAMSQVKWFASNNSRFNGDEILAMKSARAATRFPLGDMPVIVLMRGVAIDPSSDRGVERERDRQRLSADLAALSRNGKLVTASASTGHHIHIDEPELVVRSIREVLDAAAP